MLLNNKKRFIQFLNFKHAVIAFLTVISVDIFAENAPPKITFEVKTFSIEGLLPVDKEIVETYLKPLQNQQYDLKKLQEVSSGLENLIREKGFAFHRVIIPPQTLNTGNVNLKIISFELGEIAVEGNHFFSNANISNSLPALQKNQDLNTNALSESIKVANKHPSKQIQLTFKQSELEDKIDATLNVKEQRPYQFYLIGNNIGSDNSGDYRLTGGAQYSNLWNLDHVVNFSYTTSPDHASDVKQYGANYSLPIYSLKGWLSAYYAYSSVNSGTIASSDFTVTGSGEMYGLHYQQFLPKFEQYEHSLD